MEGACNTQKGNSLGFCNGYAMSLRRMRQCDGRWIWRCTNKACGGTATSTNKDDLMEDKKHHGHLPHSAVVEVRKRVSNAVSESGWNRDTPVRSIVNEAFTRLSEETLLMMPARETVTARFTRHLNKDIGSVNRAERSGDWPENMKQTKDQLQFLYYDSGKQIEQLTVDYANEIGLPRIEFLVSLGAHLEKYQGN